jgi:hypothetical protein
MGRVCLCVYMHVCMYVCVCMFVCFLQCLDLGIVQNFEAICEVNVEFLALLKNRIKKWPTVTVCTFRSSCVLLAHPSSLFLLPPSCALNRLVSCSRVFSLFLLSHLISFSLSLSLLFGGKHTALRRYLPQDT